MIDHETGKGDLGVDLLKVATNMKSISIKKLTVPSS